MFWLNLFAIILNSFASLNLAAQPGREILVPKPKTANPLNFDSDSPGEACTLQRKTSGTSSQGSFGFEMLDINFPLSATPTLSTLGYDLLDDLSVNSNFLDNKTDQLIRMLRQAHQEPISLISFDGLLKYFEENPGISTFVDEHHLELAKRVAANAANLVEVWNRLQLFVDANGAEQSNRNIFRVYALLKNYLIKTGHHLSRLFQNEVYDDQLSNASRAEGVRGDTSTICSDEEAIESDDFSHGLDIDQVDLHEETLFEESSDEPVVTEPPLLKIQSPPPALPPKRSSPEAHQNDIEQLEEIQRGLLRQERKQVDLRFLMSSTLSLGRIYRNPVMNALAKFAPSQPTIVETKASDSEEATMEEVD